jgi:localization factor PodJL
MKPGNPWSVKGIQPAARQAAKDAARRHGMTLGQWLNHVIMDSNEQQGDTDTANTVAEQPPVPQQPLPQQQMAKPQVAPQPVAAPAPKSQQLHDRIEDLAAKLDSVVNKQSGQVDLDQWQAVKGRSSGWNDLAVRTIGVEAAPDSPPPSECVPESKPTYAPDSKAEVFGERISALTDKLDSVVQARTETKSRSDKSLMELEQALRNVINHIEISDRQNTDVMKSIQTRLSELSSRNAVTDIDTVQELTSTISTMDDRLSHLSQRVLKTEIESTEYTSFEEKIKALANRLDNSLDRETEPQIRALEEQTKYLKSQIDEFLRTSGDTDTADQYEKRLNEISGRINNTEQHFHKFSTLEDNIAQLFEAVEQNRNTAQENIFNASQKAIETMETMVDQAATKAAENAAQRSAEHVAAIMADDGLNKKEVTATIAGLREEMLKLQEATINAARRSAEETISAELKGQAEKAIAEPMMVLRQQFDQLQNSSKRADIQNQDTLEAVHDTLEKVVERLVTLEAAPAQHLDRPPLPSLSAPEVNPISSTDFERAFHISDEIGDEAEIEIKSRSESQFGPEDKTEPEDKSDATNFEASFPVQPDQRIDPTFDAPDGEEVSAKKNNSSSPAPALNHNYLEAARRAALAASQMPRNIADADEGEKSKQDTKNSPLIMADDNNKRRKTLLLMAAAVLLVIGALSAGSLINKRSSNLASSFAGQPDAANPKGNSTRTKANKNSADDQSTTPPKIAKPAISPVSQTNSRELAKAVQASKSVPAQQNSVTVASIGDAAPQSDATVSTDIESPLPPKIVTSAATLNELTGTPQAKASTNSVKVARLTATAPNRPAIVNDVSRSTALTQSLPEGIGPIGLRREAESGDPTAQFEIASRYTTGKLVPQNFGKAIIWYQKAAARGLAPAQYRLGTFYEKGRGVAKDKTAARIWYERAAAKGNLKATHNLAVIYADGSKGKPDFAKAGLWFRKAAELGLADSQYNLAILHDRGLGVSKDPTKAYFWFQIAGSQGDKDAEARAAIIEKRLTPDQIAGTKLLISNWSPITLNKSANEVTLPIDGWQTARTTQPVISPVKRSAFTHEELVILAQGYLAKLGFDTGPRDGILGAQTRQAIKEFQQQNQLPVSGDVNLKLVSKLKAIAG